MGRQGDPDRGRVGVRRPRRAWTAPSSPGATSSPRAADGWPTRGRATSRSHNTGEDGYEGTAPVGGYPANGYGLLDMIGNVWEWTADWYQDHARTSHACCTLDEPARRRPGRQLRPARPGCPIPRKVMKGGSHLCAPNYCRRYRPAARMAQAVDTSTSHLGFRCIVRP